MRLPRYFALKSMTTGKYLRLVGKTVPDHHKDFQPPEAYLSFSAEDVIGPFTKFEFVKPQDGEGLVHISSGYDRKFWGLDFLSVNSWRKGSFPIIRWEKRDLFKPEVIGQPGSQTTAVCGEVRLKHKAGWYLFHRNGENLQAGYKDPVEIGGEVVFVLIDWEKLVMLPKYIAFKIKNGKYLSARTLERHPYLKFAADDFTDPTVMNEIYYTSEGAIRIKSSHFNKFWRRSPNWICADYDERNPGHNYVDTLFWPVMLQNNFIGLINFGNGQFCQSLSVEGKYECLNAASKSLSILAWLEVVEPILSRRVKDVKYNMINAYDCKKELVSSPTSHHPNKLDTPRTGEISITRKVEKVSTWTVGHSFSVGAKMEFEAGIPFLGKTKIEVSAEYSYQYSWGEQQKEEFSEQIIDRFEIPARSVVIANAKVFKSVCNIPFSYTQIDKLANGETKTYYNKYDGAYTGVKSLDVEFEYECKAIEGNEGQSRPINERQGQSLIEDDEEEDEGFKILETITRTIKKIISKLSGFVRDCLLWFIFIVILLGMRFNRKTH